MINLEGIAKIAGVSKATVSRVINNSAVVSEEKRKKVLQVIQENNLKIPEIRRSKENNMLAGVILPFSYSEGGYEAFVTDIFTGIENTAFDNDYMILMGNSEGNLEKEIALTKRMLQLGVEGFIILTMAKQGETEHLQLIQQNSLPFILVDQEVIGFKSDIVHGDNQQGTMTLMNHLFKLGHKQIGILLHEDPHSTIRDRLRGYQISLLEQNIALENQYIVRFDTDNERSGYSAAIKLLQTNARPTAVFLTDPHMLTGLLSAASELGIRIPEDLSVITFDESYVTLPEEYQNYFTNISQSGKQLGIHSFEILLQKVRNDKLELQELLIQGEFKLGKSTGLRTRE